MRSSDAPAVHELYMALDQDDARRRFFATRPGEAFASRWSSIGDRGGFGVVAVAPGPGAVIVGEAGYTLLDDGDGEFAVTVHPGWRGGLGTALIDALAHAAADRGVHNLQGEILMTNAPMLGVVRRRGCATLDHEDHVVRVSIAAPHGIPTWPPLGRLPRVLVEISGGWWYPEHATRDAGMATMTCVGPARNGHGCPVLRGQPCPLARDADVIVFALAPDDPDGRRVVAAHTELHPSPALLVAERSGQSLDLVAGATPLRLASTPDDAVAAVWAALSRSR